MTPTDLQMLRRTAAAHAQRALARYLNGVLDELEGMTDCYAQEVRKVQHAIACAEASEAKLAKAKEAIARAVDLPRTEMRTLYDFNARIDRLRDILTELEPSHEG